MRLSIEVETWLSVKAMLGVGLARRAKACIVSGEMVPREVLDWLGGLVGDDEAPSQSVLNVMSNSGLIEEVTYSE